MAKPIEISDVSESARLISVSRPPDTTFCNWFFVFRVGQFAPTSQQPFGPRDLPSGCRIRLKNAGPEYA